MAFVLLFMYGTLCNMFVDSCFCAGALSKVASRRFCPVQKYFIWPQISLCSSGIRCTLWIFVLVILLAPLKFSPLECNRAMHTVVSAVSTVQQTHDLCSLGEKLKANFSDV